MRFHVIVTAWNAEPWIERCLESIRLQDGVERNVSVVVDKSDDATADVAREYFRPGVNDLDGMWMLHLRAEKAHGVIENQLSAIEALNDPDQFYTAQPEDVYVWVDGDDRLAHTRVLARVAEAYSDGTTQLTYGSYRSEPFSDTCAPAIAYPDDVVRNNSYRRYATKGLGICWNHLRTVRVDLFNQLDDSDFRGPDGEYLQAVADAAVMFPCLELARGNFQFIPDELLVYNSENPNSEWRRHPKYVNVEHEWILSRPPK